MSVALLINDRMYTTWERVSVQRSILQAAGQFTVGYSQGLAAMVPGAAFRLQLDGHTALTGFIDGVEQNLSKEALSFSAQGRDRTADLVDCSAHNNGKTGDISELRLDEFCRYLARPLGIDVQVAKGLNVGAKRNWTQDPGQTAWQLIESACRQRAVLAISDSLGNLLLTQAGETLHPAALVEGQNVLVAHHKRDHSQRYRHYLMLEQTSDSSQYGDAETAVPGEGRAEIFDFAVRQPRTLLSVIDDDGGDTFIGDRIIWEYNVRRGRGDVLTIEVAGFSAAGVLFEPNQLIACRLPSFAIDGQWLIVSVHSTHDDAGSKTRLELMPPSAFSLLPEPASDALGSKQYGDV